MKTHKELENLEERLQTTEKEKKHFEKKYTQVCIAVFNI